MNIKTLCTNTNLTRKDRDKVINAFSKLFKAAVLNKPNFKDSIGIINTKTNADNNNTSLEYIFENVIKYIQILDNTPEEAYERANVLYALFGRDGMTVQDAVRQQQ